MNSPGKMGDADNSIQISGAVSAGEFWRFLKQEVATRGNTDVISRKITGGELLLTCASSQYKNYKDVNSNYNPITQSTPIYTNVTNGLGIVCAVNELIYKTDLVLLTLDSIFVFVPEFKLKK